MKISVIGLGKLGLCTAACFASKGFDVLGVDINSHLVESVNNHIAPFYEPKLQELLRNAGKNLTATTSYNEVIKNTDISFIIVPTPSNESGNFSDKYLRDVLFELSNQYKTFKKYHTFVIVSTVSPGTLQKSLIPIIENNSSKKLNADFGVVYNPEFIALGSVINDFLNPDLVLIGESCKNCGDIIENIYRKTCDNQPYFARMSMVSSEIAKISLNSFVTMKISFANTLGNICEKIPHANVDDITRAIGADKRVSPYYLKAGLPYGGPCFPRDNKAFLAFAKDHGVEAKLASATDEINDYQIEHIVNIIMDNLPDDRKVSIAGLAYKEGTPVIEESPAIKIIEKLLSANIIISCFDSIFIPDSNLLAFDNLFFYTSLEDCLNKSSFHLLINVKNNIQNILNFYNKSTQNLYIYDFWNCLPEIKNNNVKLINKNY